MALDLFESFFDFDGDGKLTVDDDLLFLWMMENEKDKEPEPVVYSSRVKKSDRMLADLHAKSLALAELLVRTHAEKAQAILDRSGVTEKTGRQVVTELIAAFTFVSLAATKAPLSVKAAHFDAITACCRADGDRVLTGAELFPESGASVTRYPSALIHGDLALIFRNKGSDSKAVEDFTVSFSALLSSIENETTSDGERFCFEKPPHCLFVDCALLYLKQPEPEAPAANADSPQAHVLKRIYRQKQKSFCLSALLSIITFLALSGIPCMVIWAYFSTPQEWSDLTAAVMGFLLLVGIPFAFIILFARQCFKNLQEEYENCAEAGRAYRAGK